MTLDQIFRFPKSILEQYSLAPSTKEFLQVVGLPGWDSPSMCCFDDFDGVILPRLKDWPWLGDTTPPAEHCDLIVLGCTEVGPRRYPLRVDPICVREADEIIYVLDHDQDFAPMFMNSSVMQLAAVLQSHAVMVEHALLISWEVVHENRMPLDLIQAFEHELQTIDPAALETGSFWATEIANKKQGLETFLGRREIHLEISGTVTEDYPPHRLRTVVVSTDARVVRILAEFFTHCADEIEEWEHKQWNWSHVHLRDHWPEWYSIYPDVIVCLKPTED